MNIVSIIKNADNVISGSGASESDINEAESKLGLEFAKEYKEYLRSFGAVMMNGHSFTGISKAKQLDVVTVTERERDLTENVPDDAYVIEHLGAEGIVIWQNSRGKIYQSLNGKFEKKYNTFADYVAEIIS